MEQLLTDYLRVLGPDHPETLDTRHTLAYRFGEAGDPAGAAIALEQLLTDYLRVLGLTTPGPWTFASTSLGGEEKLVIPLARPRHWSNCSPTTCGCWAPTTPAP